MADNRGTNGMFFSPAEGLAELPNPGAFSNPSQPSIHPSIDMTDKSGDTPAGNKVAEAYAGQSATNSPGMSPGVSLADAPETPSSDIGPQLGGDINVIPRPSGSY